MLLLQHLNNNGQYLFNLSQTDVDFIENKLYSSDEYIGDDVQKALTFIRNNIDELKEELRIHRNYGKMIEENPNADWIE